MSLVDFYRHKADQCARLAQHARDPMERRELQDERLEWLRVARAERDAKIYARRIEGFTLRAIAREFNLAVETVRVIIKRMERKAEWRARAFRLGGIN
jgi:hypothetical protein